MTEFDNFYSLLLWLFFILVGFLLGSIMFSKVLPKIILKKDIESISSDRNPGAANVFINCGIPLGFACLSLDILKGFLPVFFAMRILNYKYLPFALVITAPVLGHAISIFNGFKGGKCISTSFGVTLALLPQCKIVLALAVIYIFFSIIVKIKSTRYRSIVTFTVFGFISFIYLIYLKMFSFAAGCLAISVIAVLKHTKYFSFVAHLEPTEQNLKI